MRKRSSLDELLSAGLEATLREDNPWWRGERMGTLPPLRRWAFEPVMQGLKSGLAPVTVVRGPRQVGKTTLMNQAIHSVDLLAWLMGPVVEIRGQFGLVAHERIEVEDVALATLRFASGAMGVIEASTAVFPGYLKRIELHGSQGSAAMEEEDLVKWDFAVGKPKDAAIRRKMSARVSGGGGAADPKAIGHHGHARQFQDVVQAIRRGVAPAIDGREGRRAVEIILGIYKAAESGRSVALPLAADPALKARKHGVMQPKT